jgi:L-glyceraldehyde 3-phosphate reductase
MGIEYVDIFYHHRPDPETPVEESMMALDHAVRQGKALYAGISSYRPDQTREAVSILRELGTPCVIHQPNYSMFDRWIEDGLLDVLSDEGIGSIVFSPLAQGLLTEKYLDGIPDDSRAANPEGALTREGVSADRVAKARQLKEIAAARGQTLAQLALVWVLRHPQVTSALIGASRVEQIEENVAALDKIDLSDEEVQSIERILNH